MKYNKGKKHRRNWLSAKNIWTLWTSAVSVLVAVIMGLSIFLEIQQQGSKMTNEWQNFLVEADSRSLISACELIKRMENILHIN